ncbi:MAG: integrase arm-type DNA-binding domain-containing protein [bacterium]|nr:integrase arm-type DNA-binding domain-containing protein [bacterium]
MPKLTAAFVRSVTKPGKYGDQHGLILRVQPSGSKAWIWRGTVNGKRRDLGLGRYPYVSLAEARAKAFDHRKVALDGGDPVLLRSGGVPTFASAVEKVISLHAGKWKAGGKSEESWRSSLGAYVLPAIGSRLVDEITTADVMACLAPIWHTKATTAKRVRQRISAVMRWAVAQGYRADNPAGDAVTAALPKQDGGKKHHRALPHRDVGGALAEVSASKKVDLTLRLAFEFVVLTAARSGEVRGARWTEMDIEIRMWTIPAGRMKGGREHRIPLSGRALEVLEGARRQSDSPLVFPRPGGAEMPHWMLSKLPGRVGINTTLHGMRSSFRDWCGETGVAREVAEACLSHRVGNAAEQAYARSDLLERRREVMEAWAEYVIPSNSDKLS